MRKVFKNLKIKKRIYILLFLILIVFNCIPYVCAAEISDIVYYPSAGRWTEEFNWSGNTDAELREDTWVIKNNDANHYAMTQTISVEPNTTYRFSAQIRMENYQPAEESDSGATVRYGSVWDSSVYDNHFVNTPEWKTSSVIFTTQDQTSMQISFAVGGHGATCRGTAYFKDMVLEKLETNNHWNVLALIYTNVETPDVNQSFSDSEVNALKKMLAEFPSIVKNLSDSRMLIDKIDVKVIETSIKSVSGGDGDLTIGPNGDINFDTYLLGEDYQQIVVYAPIGNAPNNSGWLGLGGTWYDFGDQRIYYLIINGVDLNEVKYQLYGETFNGANASCLLHEMLHCVETNSSYFRGWDGFTPVHNNADHGYVSDAEYGWFDWYAALMRDEGLGGKGFKPQSFYVQHTPVSEIVGDISGDKFINADDLNLMARYFAGHYADDSISGLKRGDLNDDGRVTRSDVMILSRYLKNWPGYSKYILGVPGLGGTLVENGSP